MTLRPEQIGDRGQRYEVRFFTKDDNQDVDPHRVMGWAPTPGGARDMVKVWMRRPSTACVWVVDRQPDAPINEYSEKPDAD